MVLYFWFWRNEGFLNKNMLIMLDRDKMFLSLTGFVDVTLDRMWCHDRLLCCQMQTPAAISRGGMEKSNQHLHKSHWTLHNPECLNLFRNCDVYFYIQSVWVFGSWEDVTGFLHVQLLAAVICAKGKRIESAKLQFFKCPPQSGCRKQHL